MKPTLFIFSLLMTLILSAQPTMTTPPASALAQNQVRASVPVNPNQGTILFQDASDPQNSNQRGLMPQNSNVNMPGIPPNQLNANQRFAPGGTTNINFPNGRGWSNSMPRQLGLTNEFPRGFTNQHRWDTNQHEWNTNSRLWDTNGVRQPAAGQ